MLVVETISKMSRLVHVQGKSIKTIRRNWAYRAKLFARFCAPTRRSSNASGFISLSRKLKAVHDGDRQMVSILECVGIDGFPAVETGCQKALARGIFSPVVIINILARKRDPRPAAIFSIPDALRLTLGPLPGCARYDCLGRAG